MHDRQPITATSRGGATRVLIVDDHPLMRRGLAELLRDEPNVVICGEAADPSSAWQAIQDGRPELMILDLSLREGDGLELIKSVRALHPDLRILVVSMHDEKLYAERALRAGAMGYVQKQDPPEAVLQALRDVLAGKVHVSQAVSERLVRSLIPGEPRPKRTSLESLSDRELEVLNLMGEGLTTQQVAERLHLSVKTVHSHRERLKLKLRLENTAELVRYAVEARLKKK